MVSELWWSSSYEFEYHHFYFFDKNQAQDNMDLYKFKTQNLRGVLENNNYYYILKPHLIA